MFQHPPMIRLCVKMRIRWRGAIWIWLWHPPLSRNPTREANKLDFGNDRIGSEGSPRSMLTVSRVRQILRGPSPCFWHLLSLRSMKDSPGSEGSEFGLFGGSQDGFA